MFAGQWPAWGLHQIAAPALRSPGVKASHHRPRCQPHSDGPIIDAERFAYPHVSILLPLLSDLRRPRLMPSWPLRFEDVIPVAVIPATAG